MSAKSFLDTNIFLYAYDPESPSKRMVARRLIEEHAVSGTGVISYQVINEFFNVALIKRSVKMALDDARQYLHTVFLSLSTVPSSPAMIEHAIWLHQRYQLSWYDAVIVSAAQQGNCATLYSEDLQHGQQFGRLTVINPFRTAAASEPS